MNGIFRRTRLSASVVAILVIGFVSIALLHLLLTIATSQSVYELSDLKREKRELDITSQILSEQVSSLSSQQNLLSTAGKLGMVANLNPVFLSLEDKEVLGKPRPALYSTSQSRNLVANSAMIKTSRLDAETVTAATGDELIPVEAEKSILSSIPASPTR
jgi:hypothetical protein